MNILKLLLCHLGLHSWNYFEGLNTFVLIKKCNDCGITYRWFGICGIWI